MLCSMSRKGDCWDNAPMESFFATLKGELVEERDYLTRDEARADVFGYVEGFYNCSSQSTSFYVVDENRFCWAGSGTAGGFRPLRTRRTRTRPAGPSRSVRRNSQGPSARGCAASISPLSAASLRVRGATPTMAAASFRLSHGSRPSSVAA